MTVEEIKAKHQPRQLENQVEFDAIMSDILSPLWQGGGYKAGVVMRLAA
jgi:hypothetical protein